MTTRIDESDKAYTLAMQILNYTRDSLLVNLRFLDAALSRLAYKQTTGSLATDGTCILFDSKHILRLYKDEANAPTRHVLHLILHCVFQHICIPENANIRLWNLSCDIACEYTVTGLALSLASCRNDARMARAFKRLTENVDMLTAEKLYKYFLKSNPDEEYLKELEELFTLDDHSMWLTAGADTYEAEKVFWQGISHRMQIDMETFARKQGDKAAAIMLGLREVNRAVSDYEGFLKKFATKGDGMKLDMDEFDYSLYSYGMQMSGGRVPLIEQVEYKDSMRIRDIVLAIYRGNLLSSEKVRLFIMNTWNILHATESFYSKVRLHILTADENGLPEDHVITNEQEAAAFVNEHTFSPSQDYDFRAAFNKVSSLIRARAFKNLRGLLVLTDNEGIFPANMPKFPGTFIFVNDDYSVPQVPAWAIRLVLQNDEL